MVRIPSGSLVALRENVSRFPEWIAHCELGRAQRLALRLLDDSSRILVITQRHTLGMTKPIGFHLQSKNSTS